MIHYRALFQDLLETTGKTTETVAYEPTVQYSDESSLHTR
jgi:hypothetical protein